MFYFFNLSDVDQHKNRQAVKEYFEALDIMVLEVKIKFISSLQQVGNGCNCTTGNRIILKILPSDTEKVLDLGFKMLLRYMILRI